MLRGLQPQTDVVIEAQLRNPPLLYDNYELHLQFCFFMNYLLGLSYNNFANDYSLYI